MANPEHLERLKSGVESWNEWRLKDPNTIPDLRDANLREADLGGANLREADLSDTDLSRADLRGVELCEAYLVGAILSSAELCEAHIVGADLRHSDLSRVNLREADLSGADLRLADLREAVLGRANLIGANLVAANLTRADFTRADFTRADFTRADFTGSKYRGTLVGDVDLSEAIGLDQVQHLGPSTIGIDTIYKSQGRIPEAFLRGCGVPDNFIVYARSLTNSPIEFYSCFISYSTRDQEFAERLYADLQAQGVRCWFAPHDAQRGRKLLEQIDEAIRLHEKLLLILSADSIQSKWVEREVLKARKREKRDGVQVLFPVSIAAFDQLRAWECVDPDTGEDLAREVRSYLIGDFTNWKDHDTYQKEFSLLSRDLKATKIGADLPYRHKAGRDSPETSGI